MIHGTPIIGKSGPDYGVLAGSETRPCGSIDAETFSTTRQWIIAVLDPIEDRIILCPRLLIYPVAIEAVQAG
jgi:hypothetical protein